MTRCVIPVLALTLAACHPPFNFVNDSAYPDKYFLEVWSRTEAVAKANIPLDDFDIHVHDSEGQFNNACPDVDGLSCTDGATRIDILGAVGTNAADVLAATTHALGHVYYMTYEDNMDGSHLHEEWFGPGGIVELVWAYVKEYGL